MFILYIISCICFLLIKDTFASSLLNKRQAVASRTCGDQNNTVSICSPTSTSIWLNNTDQEITWKWNNPTFDQYTLLDLYLLYLNASDTSNSNGYETIKTWPGLDKSKGVLVPHIDNSWYPSPIQNNSPNVTWIMYLYIVGAGYDIETDLDLIPTAHNFFPIPQSFTLIQNSINTTATSNPTSTSTSNSADSTSTTSTNNNNSSVNNKKLAGWAIAVIVIAALLFILATAALIWAYKRYKNKNQLNGGSSDLSEDEKIPVLTPNKNESNIAVAATITATTASAASAASAADNNRNGGAGDISSIHSSTQQLWSPRSLSPRNDEASFVTMSEKPLQQQQLGLNSEANQSSSILSSTDALMIADTFRQFMRKPDWNEELELNEQKKRISSLSKKHTS